MPSTLALRLPRRMPTILGLAVGLLACFGAAALGALAVGPALGGWYTTLAKPPWIPPNRAFGPVWSLLYLLMAVAAWRVWKTRAGERSTSALTLFGIQLTLNVVWSWVFFGGHAIGAAACELALLWVATAATLRAFWPLDRPAAWLLAPYLAWLTFAFALNVAIWRLN